MNERGADHSLDERIDLSAVDGELPEVPPQIRARLLRRIEATLCIPGPGAPPDATGGPGTGAGPGAGAGAAAGAGAGSSIAPGAISVSSGWMAVGAATALSAVLVAAVVLVRGSAVEAPQRANSGAGATLLGATSAQPETAPAAPLATGSSPSPEPVASEPNRAAAPSSSAARDLDLAREHALLERARAAVAAGQGSAALASLEQHARSFPRGRLGQEREVLTIQALMQTGRHADARARGERFRRQFPKSMLLPVVDAALGTNP
jgi:hypothetical protein